MKANAKQKEWAGLYQAALNKHLHQDGAVNRATALALGRKAAKLKLETLDVARIHERSLLALVSKERSAQAGQKKIGQARLFFTETIVPIEKTHPAALRDDDAVAELTRTLRQRTLESSRSTRQLKQGIVQRQAAEADLKASGKHLAFLLKESGNLQKKLREKTRLALSGQEDERLKTSRQLHDEIVQTLIAIKLRLLTLKMASMANMASLKKEIAETQWLVKQSVQSIRRLSHEIDVYYET